jgi:mono/diheme cytochrome c family protein
VKNILFLFMMFLAFSCGAPVAEKEPEPAPQPKPSPSPNPGGKTSFAEAQAIMQTYCSECHAAAGFTKSEAGLKASSAKARVQNSTMPPPYAEQMSAADKGEFLGFF